VVKKVARSRNITIPRDVRIAESAGQLEKTGYTKKHLDSLKKIQSEKTKKEMAKELAVSHKNPKGYYGRLMKEDKFSVAFSYNKFVKGK
jgi:hypothetical protein